MTFKMVMQQNFECRRVLRDDAVRYRERYFVPTEFGKTKWVSNWKEFKEAGGQTCFNDDQTEIELLLPEPYKFGIGFPNNGENR